MIAKASAIQHGQAMTNYATKNNRADIVKTNHLSEGLPPMGMWDEMVLHQSMFKQRYAKKPIELTSIRFELSPSEEEARNWTMEDWRRFLDEFIREMDGISKVNHIGGRRRARLHLRSSRPTLPTHSILQLFTVTPRVAFPICIWW